MKGVLKVSKEQVIEIERYCDELGITRKQRIDELGLSHTAYYYTRSLLSEEELHGGQFIPIIKMEAQRLKQKKELALQM